MKKAIFIVAMLFSAIAQAVEYEEASYSKFGVCMEASILASQAYTLKTAKVKVDYPLYDDLVIAIFMKDAIDTGYRAKSRKDAVTKANQQCVTHRLWAAIKGFDE
jgi:hypothetical protein